jgi:uncharacterized tellurite resistance protein B-like protein
VPSPGAIAAQIRTAPGVAPGQGGVIRIAVINRFRALFGDRTGVSEAGHGDIELQIAVAALMVEAARMDDDFDARERARIVDLVARRFGLARDECAAVLQAAEARVHDASELYGFTRTVKQAFNQEERIDLMEMLWEVAYADGELHDFEANLMRRLAGLLHVSDRESGLARKQALVRLGLPQL